MADGRVIIETKLDTSGLASGAKSAKSTVENLGKSMETAGKQSETLDKGLQGATASLKTLETIAKSSVVVKLSQTAMKLIGDIGNETSIVVEKMKAASTLFGDVAVDQEALLENLYRISNETGESMEVLGQSVYDALSASVEPTRDMANVLNVVGNSAKLAKGGFTDTSTALSATLTVINAYKKDLTELDSVQSMLLQTQNKGVTTVGELGSALASVTPTAASFGVEFADIATSIALMTKQGTNTKVATTALAQVISELGKSGTTASENLKAAAESAGLSETSFKGLLEQGYSLGQILETMNQYARDNNKSMVDMFSSVEAGRATLQLVGSNAEDFNNILKDMQESAGLVSESFEKTVDPTERLSSAWSNMMSKIGMKIKPTVESLTSALTTVIEKVSGQDTAAYSLAETTEWLKEQTDKAKKSQDEYAKSIDAVTGSMTMQKRIQYIDYVRSVADNYESIKKSIQEAQDTLDTYTARIENYDSRVVEISQKYSMSWDEIIDRMAIANGSVTKMKKLFKGWSNTDLSFVNNYINNYEEFREKVDSTTESIESNREAISDYVNIVVDAINAGVISIETLRTINSTFASEVEEAMKTVATAAETVNASMTTAKTSSAKDILDPIKNDYKELSDIIASTSKGEILSDSQKKQLEEYKERLERLKKSYEESGDSAKVALLATTRRIEEVNKALSNNSSNQVKEMETAYNTIMTKADKLVEKQDALGNTMMSWEDVIEELNDLYTELAEKYGTTSDACVELKDKIIALKEAHSVALTPLEEMEKEYSTIMKKSEELTGKTDALGNSLRTEKDDINDLNNLYVQMVEKYGESCEAATELKKRIDKLTGTATDSSKAWKEFGEAIVSSMKSAASSVAQGLGKAVEELVYQLMTIPEQVAEIEKQIDSVAEKETKKIDDIIKAEAELKDARARGNNADIKAAEQKIADLKKEKEGLAAEKKALEDNKKATESGANAWKSASKVALEALASTLEALGAQLAAQAVVQAIALNWGVSAIALAGSVAAYAAAGAIKAAAAKYEQGGIVGGNSRHGDQILARVNSGELILNAAQQENLARVIEAAAVLAQTNGGGSGITVNFEGVNFYGLDEPAVGKAIYENIKTLQYEGVIR